MMKRFLGSGGGMLAIFISIFHIQTITMAQPNSMQRSKITLQAHWNGDAGLTHSAYRIDAMKSPAWLKILLLKTSFAIAGVVESELSFEALLQSLFEGA
jgi:hypothetical protein